MMFGRSRSNFGRTLQTISLSTKSFPQRFALELNPIGKERIAVDQAGNRRGERTFGIIEKRHGIPCGYTLIVDL